MNRKPSQLGSRYWTLFVAAYHDVVSGISSLEQGRDLSTCKLRFEKEGLSFFTKTLPSLGKAVDIALATGSPFYHTAFHRPPGTQLPNLFGVLLRDLFDDAGVPLPAGGDFGPRREAMARSLRAIRQLCYLFYKLELPFEDDSVNKVLKNFVETDSSLPTDPSSLFGLDTVQNNVLHVAKLLVHRVLCNADPLSGMPKHGPGAVSTGEKSPEKHTFKRYYAALAAVYPYDEWFYYNASHIAEDLQGLQSLQTLEAGTAKVVLVPKDSRGPRLISCEPLEYQWIQQALLDVLVRTIEKKSRLTRGFVNFTDQGVNQRLALQASVTGIDCTLDMKDASDRVSLALVKHLFPSNWVRALLAARSTHTLLPNGESVQMRKFAPMGSAVCFPVEALCFWAISVGSLIIRSLTAINGSGTSECPHAIDPALLGKTVRFILDQSDRRIVYFDGRGYTVNLVRFYAEHPVYVYGDDLICRTADHRTVVNALEGVHLKVNPEKCCTHGFFRESCGVDAFFGIDVTPVRLRTVLDVNRPILNAFPRLVGFANEAWKRGLVGVSLLMESWIRADYPKLPLPSVQTEAPAGIALVRPGLPADPGKGGQKRYNKHFHRSELRCLRSVPSLMTAPDGYSRMLREERALRQRSEDPRTGIPFGMYPLAHRDKLKCAWTPLR